MRHHDPHQLGDEPLYCEAHHDEVLVSGTDDSHYEGPQHRRIRIEAKALQFLNGHNPVLLSSRLRGPFDAASWNNPWKSRRAQHQSAPRVAATQRQTSLYPLPSPEITDPPSAAKNSFLDDNEYGRISKWREAVKSVPLITDPFWASDQGADGISRAKKRATDETWIPKRNSKRQRITNQSPSQLVASRKLRAARSARLEAQASSDTPMYEDELAVPCSGPACSILERPSKSPECVEEKRSHPSTRRRLRYHNPDMSEDELSVLSRTPSRKEYRLSSEAAITPSHRQSGKSQSPMPITMPDPSRESSAIGLAQADDTQNIRSSPPRQTGLQQAHMLENDIARPILPSSQHDDSFYFHQAGPLCNLPKPDNQLEQGDTAENSVSRRSSNLGQILMVAKKDFDTSNPADQTMPSSHEAIISEEGGIQTAIHYYIVPIKACNLDSCSAQEGLLAGTRPTKQSDAEHGALVQKRGGHEASSIAQETQNHLSLQLRDGQSGTNLVTVPEIAVSQPSSRGSNVHSNAEWSTYVNTQDLSISPADSPRTGKDNAEVSNKDWSTYINTQDVSPVAQLPIAGHMDAEVSSYVSTGDHDHENFDAAEKPQSFSTSESSPAPSDNQNLDKQLPDGQEASPASPEYRSVCPPVNDGRLAIANTSDTLQTDALDPLPDSSQHAEDLADSIGASNLENDSQRIVDDVDENQDVGRNEQIDAVAALLVRDGKAQLVSQSSNDTASAQDPSEGLSKPPESTSDHIMLDQAQQQSQLKSSQEDRQLQEPDMTMAGHQRVIDQRFCVDNLVDRPPHPVPQIDDVVKAREPETVEVSFLGSEEHHMQSPWQKESSYIPSTMTTSTESSVNLRNPNAVMDNAPSQGSEALLAKRKAKMRLSAILNDVAAPPDQTPVPNELISVQHSPQSEKKSSETESPFPLKKFSDFMDLSPCKKRKTIRGGILRRSGDPSRLLFRSASGQKTTRRVSFAQLPGEETQPEVMASHPEISIPGKQRTILSSRGDKSTNRGASPPPSSLSTTEAGLLPDQDNKFAKHFEVMAKRKKLPQWKRPRLLSPESPTPEDSLGVAAMANAFIQASELEGGAPEGEIVVNLTSSGRNAQHVTTTTGGSPDDKTSSGIPTISPIENRENVEPVDEVSAVLDNIDDFLDNTWGIDMSMDVDDAGDDDAAVTAKTNQKSQVREQTQHKTGSKRFDDGAGDPMFSTDLNVWRD
ncbi:hypothetical protein BD289DRAFT_29306 [Coniella lustricola]|uniref:Uncharacterized protein n=1 Tax=Coniella lustricola TaxID=2025994 RepID=A0A2T3AJ48_9PEZI|nr:hypothetical protein BD289DRAFT_29306 [Coniella lustricola]